MANDTRHDFYYVIMLLLHARDRLCCASHRAQVLGQQPGRVFIIGIPENGSKPGVDTLRIPLHTPGPYADGQDGCQQDEPEKERVLIVCGTK